MTDEHEKALTVVQVDRPDSNRLAPVVAQVLNANPTPEVLREILEVQKQWEANEARKAYQAALVALKRDLPASINRDKSVDFNETHYRYTSLAAVMEAIIEPLTQHGFSISWEPKTSDRMVSVTCNLSHEMGHTESATISSPPDTSGRKGPAQAVASTITLLQRYTCLSLLGIATADMEEPHGPPPTAKPELVDTAKNMRAAAAIRKAGQSVDEAEAMIGKHVADWTAGDLDILRGWLREQREDEQ